MSEVQSIDRVENIANNIDATGKKWVVFTDRQTGLAFTRPEPDRADAIIPDLLEGRWTKKPLIEAQIALYLERSCDEADKQRAKNARSNPVVEVINPDPVEDKQAAIQAAVDAENEALKSAPVAEIKPKVTKPKSKSQQKRIKVQKGK